MKRLFVVVVAGLLVVACDEDLPTSIGKSKMAATPTQTIAPAKGEIKMAPLPTPTPRPTPSPEPTLAPLDPQGPAVAVTPQPPVNQQPVSTGSQPVM